VLGVEADLDGMAARLGQVAQRSAAGDEQLLLDEIEAGHELGDGMLDLEPGVELDEPELVVRDQELGGAGAFVGHSLRQGARRVGEGRTLRGSHSRRGRLLEHLLVAALDGAVTLAEAADPAVPVGEELHFDMTRALDVTLAEHAIVTECAERLTASRLERRLELRRLPNDSHPASASSSGCLDHERQAHGARRAAR
jgi:hypothetical protein